MTTDSAIYVLVVEDEYLSRLHAVNLVEDAGYVAVEASNADEAIRILEARKDIRIVFTDIDMPGSIITSGHFDPDEKEIPERGRFFPKPYRDQEIISALHHFIA